jgi:hypothetical protein
MEKSAKRGKIPQTDWPLIMARYEAGETLASIARTYDCSPPAISYIVSRSKARQPEGEAAAAAPETQLVKVPPAPEPVAAAPPPADPPPAEPPPPPTPAPRPSFEPPKFLLRNGAGAPPRQPASAPSAPPAQPVNGDYRRTLHLSLGGNGAANGHAPERNTERNTERNAERNSERGPEPPPPAPPSYGSGQREPARYGYPAADAEAARRKDNPTFIDQELRSRVAGDIDAFLAAFDAALAGDTQDTRSALREATDRLLRAGARTRIELERLEARVPLTPRDAGRGEPAWRQR